MLLFPIRTKVVLSFIFFKISFSPLKLDIIFEIPFHILRQKSSFPFFNKHSWPHLNFKFQNKNFRSTKFTTHYWTKDFFSFLFIKERQSTSPYNIGLSFSISSTKYCRCCGIFCLFFLLWVAFLRVKNMLYIMEWRKQITLITFLSRLITYRKKKWRKEWKH